MSERQGYGLVQTLETMLISASAVNTTASIGVADYNNIVFQLVMDASASSQSTTCSAEIYSSLDGRNWQQSLTLGPLQTNTFTGSLMTTLSGRRGVVQARLIVSSSMAGSLYMLAGQ